MTSPSDEGATVAEGPSEPMAGYEERLARFLDRVPEGTLVVDDLADLSDGLKTLRALGLEDTARRAALQILILGPS